MKSILVIGASNSSRSINKRFALWAAEQISGIDRQVIDLNDYEMPIFSVDRESVHGVPQQAVDFKARLHLASGLIISLAEHNGSYAVAFKNVVDWASRLDGKLWPSTPLLLLSTSPGGRGAVTVLSAASAYFPIAGARIVGSYSLPRFNDNFQDGVGIINDVLTAEFNVQLSLFADALFQPI